MRWRMVIRVGGTLVTGIWTAISNASQVKEFVTLAGFQIQWSFIAFLAFLAFVVWWIWDLEIYKSKIEKTKPNLIFESSGQWQFYHNGKPAYRALQAWFINKPSLASESSVAKDVTALVTFYDKDMKHSFEIFGCFTEAEYPDYATINPLEKLKDKIDTWPPNEIPQKLLIALRYPEDNDAYGFAKSNFRSSSDGRMIQRKIIEGEHYIKISFSGTNIDQRPIWFLLRNPGDEVLSLSLPINKPKFRKAGYVT